MYFPSRLAVFATLSLAFLVPTASNAQFPGGFRSMPVAPPVDAKSLADRERLIAAAKAFDMDALSKIVSENPNAVKDVDVMRLDIFRAVVTATPDTLMSTRRLGVIMSVL